MTACALEVTAVPAERKPPIAAVLAAVGIPMFMVTLDNLVVTTALPVIKVQLGSSLTDLQWFVNAYTLPFAAFLLTAASIGDRLGRRRTFIAGIVLFTVASAAAGLAAESWQLTAARAVQGLGGAAITPLSLTLLAHEVPDRLRNTAVGIWSGISGLAVAGGPVVGGAVAESLGWHWIFWLNVPVGVIAAVLAGTVLRESRGGAVRLDPLGLALAAAGIFSLVWGLTAGSDQGWSSGTALTLLAGGGLLLTAFLSWEYYSHRPSGHSGLHRRERQRRVSRAARHRQVLPTAPMLPLSLFQSRGFSLVNLVTFTFAVGAFGAVFLLAQSFQVAQGLSPLSAGVRMLPWTIAPLAVAPIAGIFADRIGLRRLIVAGQAFLATGLFWTALGSATDVSYRDLVVPLALAGIGMGLTYAPISTMALASVGPKERGVASGANNTIHEVGAAVGVAVIAAVFSSYGGYTSRAAFINGLCPAVMVGAAIIAVGAVVAVWLPSRPDHVEPPHESSHNRPVTRIRGALSAQSLVAPEAVRLRGRPRRRTGHHSSRRPVTCDGDGR